MNAQHTPAPWVNHGRISQQVGVPHSAVAAKTLIARVYSEAYGDHAEEKANADLIAAAPELLAICQELRESAEYWSEYMVPIGIVERLTAAIDKATGGPQL